MQPGCVTVSTSPATLSHGVTWLSALLWVTFPLLLQLVGSQQRGSVTLSSLRRVFISTHQFSQCYSLDSLPHPTGGVRVVAGVKPYHAGKIVNLLYPLLLLCLLSLIKPQFNTRDKKITPQNAFLSLEEIGVLFSIETLRKCVRCHCKHHL